jgi:aldose 1-epimerase
MTQAANYTAERIARDSSPIVRLADQSRNTEVLISPSRGNNAYSMKINGHQVMWNHEDFWRKPVLAGNPFLWPWANRIAGETYWANGKKYLLNTALGNVRKDGNQNPIHGLVAFSDAWEVRSVEGGDSSASVTSRLEFWKHPDWMAQFPFAHAVDMTYRLRDGVLEVETVVENLSTDPLPISLGYHPYFQLTDSPRDDWNVHLAARNNVELSSLLIPTGVTSPNTRPDPFPLRGSQLDNVFTNLVRDSGGRAVFSVTGKVQKLEVLFGPKYPVAVVYAPPGGGFICFEPMAGPTNGFNLGHERKFPLQHVPPGAQWRESFWVQPSGF